MRQMQLVGPGHERSTLVPKFKKNFYKIKILNTVDEYIIYIKTDLIHNKHPLNFSNLKNMDYTNPCQILLKYIITDGTNKRAKSCCNSTE